VPCGSNWAGWKRRQLGIGADDVMGKLVQFGRANIASERLMGFMMATWETSVDKDESLQKILNGIDQLAAAMR
jgi:hypothetical protein